MRATLNIYQFSNPQPKYEMPKTYGGQDPSVMFEYNQLMQKEQKRLRRKRKNHSMAHQQSSKKLLQLNQMIVLDSNGNEVMIDQIENQQTEMD